jgi:hypothetical protein
MNKIITDWTIKNDNSQEILNTTIKLFIEKDIMDLDLVNLNLINEIFYISGNNTSYWFISKKTGELYYVHNNIDNDINNIIMVLSELNMHTYYDIMLTSKQQNIIKTIKKQYVEKLNGSSRDIRCKKRNYIKALLMKQIEKTLYKKPKITEELKINWSTMVSASSTRNYMLDDMVIDYYKEYNIMSLSSKPKKGYCKVVNDIHTQYILDNGVKFEEEEIKIIRENHMVSTVADNYIDSRNPDKFHQTIKLMKQGVPIIYQGVLHDYEEKTFGLPDLIIRADYLNTLMGSTIVTDDMLVLRSPLLGVDWYYVVVDIKHSTIPLKVDMVTVAGGGDMMPYKAQIYIYTMILNKIQGTNISKGYIFGKKYECGSLVLSDYRNRLGTVIFDSELENKTNNACNWIRKMRSDGMNWKLLPTPSQPELYPNMKNKKDGPWREIKSQFSKVYNEITEIWNCSYKHRMEAISKGIVSYMDERCTAANMGMNSESKTGMTVDSILFHQRQNERIINVDKVTYDRNNWYNVMSDTIECFLDYETINLNNEHYIFMIGYGYEQNDKKWRYNVYIMEELSQAGEKNMFLQFYQSIDSLLEKMGKQKVKFYHWSCAETVCYNKFKDKDPTSDQHNRMNYSYYDLSKVFISQPIIVKDALTFSLKTVARAMYKAKLINTIWSSESECSNGLIAMILAYKLYQEKSEESKLNNNTMKEIIHYNEVDCKTMWEILTFLRTTL